MRKIYVFGHKKPDTDSISAAISMAYFKNQLGESCEARSLGNLNKETKFALNYFKLPMPAYLNDVKLQLKDIEYHKGFMVKDTDSIYNGYQMMIKEGLTGLPVVQSDAKFLGLVTIKDLSHSFITDEVGYLNTSYSNLLKVLKAEEVLRFDSSIEAEILIAAYRSTTFMKNVKLNPDIALIVGDRHSIIEYAIESKIKLLIISGDGEIKAKHLELARKNKVNIIRSSYDTYHISKLISLANYIYTTIKLYDPIKFEDTDYVDDIVEINHRLRHTNYPVVNKDNKCLGLLKFTDLSDKKPKQVILVDHNEPIQSADGIEEAEILEIVDHHNLGNITTRVPVNFRNVAVGSTNTIIYGFYKDKRINIPKDIAGIMLSGILSDTLILKSPTATSRDRIAVEELAKIAGVDYNEYGMKMLKAGTSLANMTKEEVLYNDFKVYTVNDKTFAVGQFFTMDFSEIKKEIKDYVKVLDEVCTANDYELVALYFTDIIKDGSYMLFNRKAKDSLEAIYDIEKLEQGHFFEGCVSRKKHVIPVLMELFEN